VEFEEAIDKVAALAGQPVEAELLSCDDGCAAIAQLSGLLSTPDEEEAAVDRPVTFRIGDSELRFWADRFVQGDTLGSTGAVELVTEDVIVVIGPMHESWIDEVVLGPGA
jgi:hypothetical protein